MKNQRDRKQPLFIQVLLRLFQNKTATVSLAVLLIIIFLCICAPWIAPYSPKAIDPRSAFAPPSLQHLCGCDSLGRDLFSRLLYGGQFSLALGFSCAAIGLIMGSVLGTLAGYFGGWVDNLILRIFDVIHSIPGILLSICISAVLGSGFFNTVLACCIGGIDQTTRMLRANILSERRQEYLEAAESINCRKSRIMFKHLLPNVISPCIVQLTMGVGGSMMMASSLSFIGLGVQPPTPEWGAMLSAGKGYISSYPHMILFPGLIIAVVVLCINLFGDGLRDAMDPKMKR